MKKLFCLLLGCLLLTTVWAKEQHWVQGIYVSQSTLEKTQYLDYLIRRSNEVGIDTFVIDLNRLSKRYIKNIQRVKSHKIRYVARIVIFPKGGTKRQVMSLAYREKKYKLIQQAITAGAESIQLDYIRYKSKQRPSPQNAVDIYNVIQWFKQRIEPQGIPLQVAVFGETAFGESINIGQDLKLFANVVDVVCPMLYPSHFEPYKKHAKQPYKTIYTALTALRRQFKTQKLPFKVYTYIEITNYRYQYKKENRLGYIYEQIRAVEDAHADGWYAWSANNHYDKLFRTLSLYPHRVPFNVSSQLEAEATV